MDSLTVKMDFIGLRIGAIGIHLKDGIMILHS